VKPLPRDEKGKLALPLQHVMLIVGLVSALWAGVRPASRWLWDVDTAVYEVVPTHIQEERERHAKLERLTAEIAAQNIARQISMEMACEEAAARGEPRSEHCRDVLREKRLRERER
jgi:hypothetical protein